LKRTLKYVDQNSASTFLLDKNTFMPIYFSAVVVCDDCRSIIDT